MANRTREAASQGQGRRGAPSSDPRSDTVQLPRWVVEAVLKEGLSLSRILLALALRSLDLRTGEVAASIAVSYTRLTQVTGLSRTAVINAVRVAETKGYLERTAHGRSWVYELKGWPGDADKTMGRDRSG